MAQTFTLNDLEKRVQARAQESADVSYTRKLLDRGVAHCAKKLGEEAVEAAIAAVGEDRRHIIGGGGSVAGGKSTTARVLQALLARWPNVPKVDLITTDGFLYPNAVLDREGLMEKKGFPESYDLPALLRFLSDIKAGRRPVRAPVYSHLIYDVIPNQCMGIAGPEILIVEGLNVLQAGRLPKDGKAVPFVSDFFDFSVYLDADDDVLMRWYVQRFLALR